MILKLEGITKKFGGLTALSGVDLNVEAGEIVGLIGPNGAGKSTLLNVIGGVYKPSAGAVWFKGEKISGLTPDRICQKGVGRTFQICRPFPKMSILENVVVAATFGRPTPPKDPEAEAREILAFVGFPLDELMVAESLNTAQLRRLDLARALASRPQLLLMDEAAAGLTLAELADLQNLVYKIRDKGTTVVIVEHLMRLIMQLCDRIMVLQYGQKIAEGTPSQIADNETVTNAYLGEKYLLTQ
jgi:branched-chain amino acid transport system ATP-binding protein